MTMMTPQQEEANLLPASRYLVKESLCWTNSRFKRDILVAPLSRLFLPTVAFMRADLCEIVQPLGSFLKVSETVRRLLSTSSDIVLWVSFRSNVVHLQGSVLCKLRVRLKPLITAIKRSQSPNQITCF